MSNSRWGCVSKVRYPLFGWFAALAFSVAGCATDGGERLETRVFSFQLGLNWSVDSHDHEGVLAVFPASIQSVEDAERMLVVSYCFRGQLPPSRGDDASARDTEFPYAFCGDSLACGPQATTEGVVDQTDMRIEGEIKRLKMSDAEGWAVPVGGQRPAKDKDNGYIAVVCNKNFALKLLYMGQGARKQVGEEFDDFLRTFRWLDNPFALPD